MNKLGQFLLIPLIIILSLVGIFLSGRLLTARNKMTKAFDDVYKINVDQALDLDKKQVELNGLLADITGNSLGWEQTWDGRQAGLVPDQLLLGTDLGTNDGLSISQVPGGQLAPHLYAFIQRSPGGSSAEQPDGVVRFVGEMEVGNLQAQQSAMKPTWMLAPNEALLWQPQPGQQQKWRFRSQIPQSYKSRFEDQHARLLRAFQNGQTLEQQIALQNNLVQLANEDLNVRLGELVRGNPQAEPQEDRPELSIGLVAAIEAAEELRNELQKDVDDLRRMIKVESDLQVENVVDLQEIVGAIRPAKTKISKK
jgi:hypothetical protein